MENSNLWTLSPYKLTRCVYILSLGAGDRNCCSWEPLSSDSLFNACTLVPTVFLRPGKMEFELPFLFSVYPRLRKTDFEIPFSFSVFLLHWKWTSSFCFRFWFSHDFGQQNSNSHFRFSSFVFVRYWKTKFDLRFSFLRFYHFRILPEPEEWRHFLSQKAVKAWARLEDRQKTDWALATNSSGEDVFYVFHHKSRNEMVI